MKTITRATSGQFEGSWFWLIFWVIIFWLVAIIYYFMRLDSILETETVK